MISNISNAVAVSDGKVTTTSLKIAEVFGKQHFHVIRDIEKLQVPDNFKKSNFGLTEREWKNSLGKTVKDKVYIITRDGFTILVMGFTGAKAMQFKIAYLEEFNRMEAKLRELQGAPVQPESPLPATEPLRNSPSPPLSGTGGGKRSARASTSTAPATPPPSSTMWPTPSSHGESAGSW